VLPKKGYESSNNVEINKTQEFVDTAMKELKEKNEKSINYFSPLFFTYLYYFLLPSLE